MKVCILAPVHPWDDTRVYQKEACSLAGAGYDVTLIAQAPRPSVERGVRIQPAPRSRSRALRFLKLPRVLIDAVRMRAALYHLHNPDTLPLAVMLKLLGRRVIYDTHEDFAQRLLIRDWIPTGFRHIAAWLVATAEAVVARLADASIATQQAVKARLGSRCELIENPPVTEGPLIDEALARARSITRGDELRLIYAGGIGRARGLDVMVDALALLNSQGIAARLWLIGWGDQTEIDGALRRPGGAYVDFVGRVPQAEAFAYMLRADLGLATILDVADHARTSANKLYEYLLFGLPVVASDFPRWRRGLISSAALAFVPAGDTSGVAAAMAAIARLPDRGKAAAADVQRQVRAQFSWQAESAKLLELYRRVLGNQATA